MDKELTRPQMGHAMAEARKCFARSHMHSPHQKEPVDTMWFHPNSLEMCGQICWSAWPGRSALRVSYGSPEPTDDRGAGLHEETKRSVSASTCSVLGRSCRHIVTAVEGGFLKERKFRDRAWLCLMACKARAGRPASLQNPVDGQDGLQACFGGLVSPVRFHKCTR